MTGDVQVIVASTFKEFLRAHIDGNLDDVDAFGTIELLKISLTVCDSQCELA